MKYQQKRYSVLESRLSGCLCIDLFYFDINCLITYFFCLISEIGSFHKTKNKTKNTLVSGNAVDKKTLFPGSRKFIYF